MDTDLLYIDSMAGDLFLESEADISRYRSIFDNLVAVALSPKDSVINDVDLSGASGGRVRALVAMACVEVAFVGEATAVRDSKNSTGPALVFGPERWGVFRLPP